MKPVTETSFDENWNKVEALLMARFGKLPDLEGILYLIGINELGRVPEEAFSKEQKQDLMHIATCALLAQSGYYVYAGHDEDGWPHYTLVEAPQALTMAEQEQLLKQHIITYFEAEAS